MISIPRILGCLDNFLEKNDYDGAEKHLLYWIDETRRVHNHRIELLLYNELIGLYRKTSREAETLHAIRNSLQLVRDMHIENNIGAGTTYLNCANAYCTFGRPEAALPLFKRALDVYERELPKTDHSRGGLYNNVAATLVALRRFDEAYQYYNQAIEIMSQQALWLEVAITYLDIASAKEAELGLAAAKPDIERLLDQAAELLDKHEDTYPRVYYEFICEKCAPIYEHCGRFMYKNTLLSRVSE